MLTVTWEGRGAPGGSGSRSINSPVKRDKKLEKKEAIRDDLRREHDPYNTRQGPPAHATPNAFYCLPRSLTFSSSPNPFPHTAPPLHLPPLNPFPPLPYLLLSLHSLRFPKPLSIPLHPFLVTIFRLTHPNLPL